MKANTSYSKLIREGHFLAEVDVELPDDGAGWSQYLSPGDACKLDDVRAALHRGDLKTAGRLAWVFELHPVTTP